MSVLKRNTFLGSDVFLSRGSCTFVKMSNGPSSASVPMWHSGRPSRKARSEWHRQPELGSLAPRAAPHSLSFRELLTQA
jgi:hypothetical protein